MRNRRSYYRLTFEPAARLPARLRLPGGTVHGQVADLSIGGLAFVIPAAADLAIDRGTGAVTFTAPPGEEEPLTVPVALVHTRRGAETTLGLQFLPTTDLQATEAREKKVWSFLLDEQRRQRRRALAG